MAFAESDLTLQAGEAVFLYTDGVTEAMNSKQELYGNERTRAGLSDLRQRDCAGIVDGITADLARFVDGADQSDDITMLIVRYFSPNRGK